MSDTVASTLSALETAKAAFISASDAFQSDSSDANLTALQAAARTKSNAQTAYNAAVAAQNTSATGATSVTFIAQGKDNRKVFPNAGSTVRSALEAAGWNTDGITVAVLANGGTSTVTLDWQIPAGEHQILVQSNVRGG